MLLRLLDYEWRGIGTAPFDCEIELAIIDGDIKVPAAHTCVTTTAGLMPKR
jgi:hypothetical protein